MGDENEGVADRELLSETKNKYNIEINNIFFYESIQKSKKIMILTVKDSKRMFCYTPESIRK